MVIWALILVLVMGGGGVSEAASTTITGSTFTCVGAGCDTSFPITFHMTSMIASAVSGSTPSVDISISDLTTAESMKFDAPSPLSGVPVHIQVDGVTLVGDNPITLGWHLGSEHSTLSFTNIIFTGSGSLFSFPSGGNVTAAPNVSIVISGCTATFDINQSPYFYFFDLGHILTLTNGSSLTLYNNALSVDYISGVQPTVAVSGGFMQLGSLVVESRGWINIEKNNAHASIASDETSQFYFINISASTGVYITGGNAFLIISNNEVNVNAAYSSLMTTSLSKSTIDFFRTIASLWIEAGGLLIIHSNTFSSSGTQDTFFIRVLMSFQITGTLVKEPSSAVPPADLPQSNPLRQLADLNISSNTIPLMLTFTSFTIALNVVEIQVVNISVSAIVQTGFFNLQIPPTGPDGEPYSSSGGASTPYIPDGDPLASFVVSSNSLSAKCSFTIQCALYFILTYQGGPFPNTKRWASRDGGLVIVEKNDAVFKQEGLVSGALATKRNSAAFFFSSVRIRSYANIPRLSGFKVLENTAYFSLLAPGASLVESEAFANEVSWSFLRAINLEPQTGGFFHISHNTARTLSSDDKMQPNYLGAFQTSLIIIGGGTIAGTNRIVLGVKHFPQLNIVNNSWSTQFVTPQSTTLAISHIGVYIKGIFIGTSPSAGPHDASLNIINNNLTFTSYSLTSGDIGKKVVAGGIIVEDTTQYFSAPRGYVYIAYNTILFRPSPNQPSGTSSSFTTITAIYSATTTPDTHNHTGQVDIVSNTITIQQANALEGYLLNDCTVTYKETDIITMRCTQNTGAAKKNSFAAMSLMLTAESKTVVAEEDFAANIGNNIVQIETANNSLTYYGASIMSEGKTSFGHEDDPEFNNIRVYTNHISVVPNDGLTVSSFVALLGKAPHVTTNNDPLYLYVEDCGSNTLASLICTSANEAACFDVSESGFGTVIKCSIVSRTPSYFPTLTSQQTPSDEMTTTITHDQSHTHSSTNTSIVADIETRTISRTPQLLKYQ